MAQGERIDFCLSNLNGHDIAGLPVRILRMGPRPAELVSDAVDVRAQKVPAERGWESNGWEVSYTLDIGSEWVSGIYALRAGRPRDDTQDVFFIVKSARPGATAPIVVQLPTTTINAYNNWGGASLYGYNSVPCAAPAVSFNRPQQSDSTWKRGYGFADEWNQRIKAFVLWLEAMGYRADYIANNDLHEDSDLLRHYRLFVSIGHDEYWSQEMRDNFDTFVGDGGNAAILGGNTCYWQVRLEADERSGTPHRRQICYRDAAIDPIRDPTRKTVTWRELNRPENLSFGAGYGAGAWKGGGKVGSFTVHRPDHWAFSGTGLAEGDTFGGNADEVLLGYESNGVDYIAGADGRPVPSGADGTPRNYVILALADLAAWDAPGNAAMGLFTRPGGGTVFNAATTDWARGLESCIASGDALRTATAKITRNVIEHLTAGRPPTVRGDSGPRG